MDSKLSALRKLIPLGLLVDGAWLREQSYSSSLVVKYVQHGWLEQPTRGAYRRSTPGYASPPLDWRVVVVSLQRLRQPSPIAGGLTALHLSHVSGGAFNASLPLHLYGPVPPSWARRLLGDAARFHALRLFEDDPVASGVEPVEAHVQSWIVEGVPGHLLASTPERAFLELLNEVPARAEFQAVLPIVRQLQDLDPPRLGELLRVCRSVKVKRLALWFGDLLGLPWAARLDRGAFDLGRGNRVLAPGGRLEAAYGITVPRDLVRL